MTSADVELEIIAFGGVSNCFNLFHYDNSFRVLSYNFIGLDFPAKKNSVEFLHHVEAFVDVFFDRARFVVTYLIDIFSPFTGAKI